MEGTLYDYAVVKNTVSPAVRTNGTVNGTAVNLGAVGSDAAIVAIVTGVVTDGSHATSIEHSDTGTSGWTAVPAAQLTATAPTVTSANSNTQLEVGVNATKPYLRVTVVTTGATTGGLLAAVVVMDKADSAPISHA